MENTRKRLKIIMSQALININDFKQAAKHLLDSSVYDFICGGANDEVSLKENDDTYNKIKLAPKILSGVENPDTMVSLLGQNLDTPILIAPMAFQKLVHHGGEMEVAVGAKLAHTIMLISIFSTAPLEKIIPELSLPPWFQLYFLKDREINKAIVELAEFVGCGALVITVDAPSYGKRERELRNPINCEIAMPDLLKITRNISPSIQLKYAKDISSFLAATITWRDIEWVKSITKLPILLKGILRSDDAGAAVAHGIEALLSPIMVGVN
jgi:4-hydroxymandelate oxidase